MAVRIRSVNPCATACIDQKVDQCFPGVARPEFGCGFWVLHFEEDTRLGPCQFRRVHSIRLAQCMKFRQAMAIVQTPLVRFARIRIGIETIDGERKIEEPRRIFDQIFEAHKPTLDPRSAFRFIEINTIAS